MVERDTIFFMQMQQYYVKRVKGVGKEELSSLQNPPDRLLGIRI